MLPNVIDIYAYVPLVIIFVLLTGRVIGFID